MLGLSFLIPGPPVGQGRPRFARCGRSVRVYNPRRSQNWQMVASSVFRAVHRGAAIDGLVAVTIEAVLHRPQRLNRNTDPRGRIPCGIKPDVDNIAKAVLDALVKGGVLRDDALVTELHVSKCYAAIDEDEAVEVSVQPMPEGFGDA